MKRLVTVFALMLCVGVLQAQEFKASSVTELENALSSATSGQRIAIAGGTFEPAKVFQIAAGVTLEGGYSGDFASRDIVANETIIDGKGLTDLFVADGKKGWVLDGLTLKGGFANHAPENIVVNQDGTVSADRKSGSALRLVNGAQGTLLNVKVTGNNISSVQTVVDNAGTMVSVDNMGSAIFVGGASKLTIENCEISENFDVAQEYVKGTSSSIERRSGAVILANTTGEGGLTIKDSDIINNPSADQSVLAVMQAVAEADKWGDPGGPLEGSNADTLGGGLIVITGGDQSWITGCTIRNNMVGRLAVNGLTYVKSVAVFVMDGYTTIEQNYSHTGGFDINGGFVLLENLVLRDNASINAFLQGSTAPALPLNFEVNNILVERNRSAFGRFMYTRFTHKGTFTNSIIRNNICAPRGDRILEMRSVGGGPTVDLGLAIFSGNIVENNLDARRPGIEFTANRTEISNNVIRGNNTVQSTIQIESPMAELYMFNNILADNIVHASNEGWILEMRRPQGDVFVFNNTFYNNESRLQDVLGFQTENMTTVGYKNNLLYHNVADSGQRYLFGSLAFQQDLVKISNNLVGAWDGNILGWDPHEPPFFAPGENGNIDLGNGNPMFVNALESVRGAGPAGEVYLHNLSLLEGAPARDTGTDPVDFYADPYPSYSGEEALFADPTKDINGRAREAGKWDIGAYEGQHEVSGVAEKPKTVSEYKLSQSYPNPFNPSAKIDFALPKSEHVRLIVYDALGRQVVTLVDGKVNAGAHTVQFDGSKLPSGLYFYRLEAGAIAKTRKMMLLK